MIDDEPLETVGRERLARRIAVVPQQAVLPFAMRVEEVVALGRLPHEDQLRGARPVDRAAVAEAIDLVGLGGLVGRDVRELSLGERQLVLVGLAVAQSSDVVILDEPTIHLDLRHQVEVMELLVALNQGRGLTIVAVLHDLALAAAFFPRIVMLEAGRVVADGAPDEVLTRDRIREVFGVDPGRIRLPDAAIAEWPWPGRHEARECRAGGIATPVRAIGRPTVDRAAGRDRAAHAHPGRPDRGGHRRRGRVPVGRAGDRGGGAGAARAARGPRRRCSPA